MFWGDAKVGTGLEGSIKRKGSIAGGGPEMVFCIGCLGIEFTNDAD